MSFSEELPRSRSLEVIKSRSGGTAREANDLLSRFLEDRYPNRRIELMKEFGTAFQEEISSGKIKIGPAHASVFDKEAQKSAIRTVLWFYLMKEEYKGSRFSRKELPRRLELLKGDARTHLLSFVELYESLAETISRKIDEN